MTIERIFWKWGQWEKCYKTKVTHKVELSSWQKRSRHLSDHPPSGRLIPSSHEQPSPPKAYLASHPGLLCLSSPHYQCLHLNNHPHLSHLKVIVSSPTKMWSPHNLYEEPTSPCYCLFKLFQLLVGLRLLDLKSHHPFDLNSPKPFNQPTISAITLNKLHKLLIMLQPSKYLSESISVWGEKMNSVKRTTFLMFSFSIHNVSYTWGIFRHLV